MNIIEIMGNVGSDPVVRVTPKGLKVTNFTVAVNSKRGENTYTTWYKIVVWEGRYDKMMTYIKKGSSLIVIGELSPPEIYKNKNNEPQIALEITAEIIRFNPFGKSDSSKDKDPVKQEESVFGQSQQKHEDQNLPF